jgi:L-lactate dehydrogenase complex protein LldG
MANQHDAATAVMPSHGDPDGLVASFARELDAVGGRFLGVMTDGEAAERTVALAHELGASRIAIGVGVAIDPAPIASALERAGLAVMRTAPARDDAERAAMRDELARTDLGIAEAHFAIASTGTLALVASDARPSSLTLLPAANLALVRADRFVPDLAAALASLGADTFAAGRVVLITGPSRTADIEKRIVLGVHGPRAFFVIAVRNP